MMVLGLIVACLQGPNLDGDAGFQGTVFYQSWARISASVFHDGEPIDGELRFTLRSGIQESVVYRRPLPIGRKARMRIGQDVFLSGKETELEVELWSKGKSIRKSALLLNFIWGADHRLLAVGPLPELLGDGLGPKSPVSVVRTTAELLPASPLPLSALDTIVLPEPIDLTPGQEDALRQWVNQGGRLVFFAGRSTMLRQHPLWREWCPLADPQMAAVPLPGRSSLESVTMVRGALRNGVALQSLGPDPVVIRSPQGIGQIVFFAFPHEQPFVRSQFPGKSLVPIILDFPPPPKEELKLQRPRPGWPVPGPGEQITMTLESVFAYLLPWESPTRDVSLHIGLAIGVIYILLLGPWQYVRMKRKGRLRKGWLPFGILVLICVPIILVWGGAFSPRPPRLAFLQLWDEDRVQSFGTLRTAGGDTYQVTSSGTTTPLPPARALGARDPIRPIDVDHPSVIRLPIPATDARSFVASRPVMSGEPAVTATWKDGERRSLRLQNPSPVYLRETWVISKDLVWSTGPLAGGTARQVDLRGGEPLNLYVHAYPVRGEKRDPRSAYFPKWDSVYPLPIAGLALTFFETFQKARGETNNQYQVLLRGLDLSPALARGELFFVGSFSQDLSGIRVDPEVSSTVYGWFRARVQEPKK
jgi:hypothetical protein